MKESDERLGDRKKAMERNLIHIDSHMLWFCERSNFGSLESYRPLIHQQQTATNQKPMEHITLLHINQLATW
jgi:hypothetical protein